MGEKYTEEELTDLEDVLLPCKNGNKPRIRKIMTVDYECVNGPSLLVTGYWLECYCGIKSTWDTDLFNACLNWSERKGSCM